jgi:hypothetical protein
MGVGAHALIVADYKDAKTTNYPHHGGSSGNWLG